MLWHSSYLATLPSHSWHVSVLSDSLAICGTGSTALPGPPRTRSHHRYLHQEQVLTPTPAAARGQQPALVHQPQHPCRTREPLPRHLSPSLLSTRHRLHQEAPYLGDTRLWGRRYRRRLDPGKFNCLRDVL
jgi:hypothetical protein